MKQDYIKKQAVFIAIVLVAMLLSVLSSAAYAQQNLLARDVFGPKMEGWSWEQWLDKPLPGVVDPIDKAGGVASFKMGLPGAQGGRWIAHEVRLKEIGRDHVFSFMLKLDDVPENAARVRLAIENKGFFKGDDLVRLGGAQSWKTYRFVIPGSALGDSAKVTIFLYDDRMDRGRIGIGAVSFRSGGLAPGEVEGAAAFDDQAVLLVGDTSQPVYSTFAAGEKVELNFSVHHLKASDKPVTLDLSIVDEHDKKIEERRIPVQADAEGRWQTIVSLRSQRLGFYRVDAKLSNGVPLQALGSRAAGFLTYAVVPDPAKRADYGELGSRFGMQGGFGPWADKVLPLIGARWVLDGGLEWGRNEPERTGQFGPDQAGKYAADPYPQSSPWRQYALPTLMRAPQWAVIPATFAYMTGTLTPSGEKAWSAYCRSAARSYMAKYPQRKEHIYQITWEPIQPWGFKGGNADLVRIYEIAYKALHEVDPHAVVAGPTRGIYNNGDPQETVNLFKLGLGKYLDGYTSHPYHSMTPEQDGMPQAIREIKALLHASTGRDIPMMGTEQGWTTNEDVSKELLQAQGLIRQNLIALGEGFRFNMGFYIADYRLSGQKGYGYYYNLDKEVPFGPQKVSPKPIVPAYAAQSMLLDGCKSAGAIEWLGDKVLGYVFERPGRKVLAVWSYGAAPREVSLPTGVKQVHLFDWMGNERLVKTVGGTLRLSLGPEPIYLSGVSPTLWGSMAVKALAVDQSRFQVFPDQRLSLTGGALLPADKPFQGTLILETDAAWRSRPLTRPIAMGSNRRAPFRFDLHVPATLRSGTYAARLVLHDAAGDTLSAIGVTFKVVDPLAVQVQPLFNAGEKPGVAVTLRDRERQGFAGRLAIRFKELLPGAQRSDLPMIDLISDPGRSKDVPGAGREVAFKIAPGAARRLVITMPEADFSPTRRYQALLAVTGANGCKFVQAASVVFLPAKRLRRPPTIDADLSDWPPAPVVALTGPRDVIRSPEYYPREAGLSAQLRYAWDEQALYLAAEVKDDVFFQKYIGSDIWRGDCLQLAFNLDPQLHDDAPNATDRRTSELTIALTQNGPEAFRQLSFAPEKLKLGDLTPQQIRLAIRRIGAGDLIYEMAIPWTSLGWAERLPLQAGDMIGVAATVNEVRSNDQSDPCALGLFGGIAAGKDPDKFGTLVLEGR